VQWCLDRDQSVPAEPSWWLDSLEVGEVEFTDRLQGIGGCAFVQAGRHCLEPSDALTLHRCQFGDGITPALDAAASVGWGADAGGGLTRGLSSSVMDARSYTDESLRLMAEGTFRSVRDFFVHRLLAKIINLEFLRAQGLRQWFDAS
jgi:hypothetical protein